ncbi:HEPN domain-containing protein [Zoogloeaceae bacterium G21618-S1]|nr:HEPN domain-containing protein [Zoogloeaceae bacterium G21618-S1]
MNNNQVKQLLDECEAELNAIVALILGIGDGAKPTPYVKKYAVIRATGAIESGFKKIIADRVDKDSHAQLKNFVKKKIRNSSCNPKLDMIVSMLADFDSRWQARFEEKIALSDKPSLKGALSRLVNARNSFAHGGPDELPIEETVECFRFGRSILEHLDATVHEEYEVLTDSGEDTRGT